MSDLRRWMQLVESHLHEAGLRPSQALLDAAMGWVKGWTSSERNTIENVILSVRGEAMLFTASKYGILYRAQSLSDDHLQTLLHGKPISIPIHRLTSWSTLKSTATMFFEGDGENMVIIAKRNLTVILDIMRIARFFDIGGMDDEHEHLSDMIRDAAREREVVCEHIGSMMINPSDIVKH